MPDDDLDDVVRRADPDRWLSSRFIADRSLRLDVLAIYAFDHHLDRAERVASNSLIAEIRLAWWREVVDEIHGGKAVREHPVAVALAAASRRHQLPRGPMEAMIDARVAILGRPVLDLSEALAWADQAGGSTTILASKILDPEVSPTVAAPAGRIWGLVSLIKLGRVNPIEARRQIVVDMPHASRVARRLVSAAFPSVAHATLARGRPRPRSPALLSERFRLLWAVATGRI